LFSVFCFTSLHFSRWSP